MPYCTPPIVKSWSKKGEFPNTNPERVESPITNRTGDVLPAPPSGPPDCEIPIECIVPPVGKGRSMRVSRNSDTPNVERMQLLHRSAASPVLEPVKLWSSTPYETNSRV